MTESMESRCLREHYDQFVRGIQDPSSLADTLFARGLISDTVRDETHQILSRAEKCRKLLSAVECKLAIEPDTFEVFVAVLKEEPTLAIFSDRLKETYGHLMEMSSLNPREHRHLSSAVASFAAYLHDLYQCRMLPMSKGQPTPGKHYINLAVISKEDIKKEELDEFTMLTIHGKVDDIIKKKIPIGLQQIGRQENGSFVRCVLVEGAPGVGKTTLAWEICRRWKEMLAEFDIVLLLTLRDISLQEATCLSELFRYPNAQLQKDLAQEISDKDGPSVLLILEGYDEMPPHIQRDSIFSKIIEGIVFPQASVLITTRPSSRRIVYEKCLHQKFQHIEVVGFTSTDIDNYIHDVMGKDEDSMQKFYEYLNRHPQIRTMMSNPLNCGLTVNCYQYYEGSDVALKTQTELYSNVTKMLIIGELSSKQEYLDLEELSITTLSDLPEDIHQKLVDLSQFAYNGIVKNTLVFQEFPPSLDTLGLVQKSKDMRAPSVFSYNFIHLKLQEFLAAYHISLLSPSKQTECIDTHIHQDHMQVVLRFMAGLKHYISARANRGSFWKSIKNVFKRTPIKCLKSYVCSSETKFFMESVHWLLEMQDKDIVQSTVGHETHKHILSGQLLSPIDCYALGYCIENSKCQWKLELRSCGIGNEAAKALCQGSLQNIEVLNLSRNKVPALGSILSAALRSNCVLTELRVEGCGMNEEGTAELTGVLQSIPSLRVLDLSLNDVGAEAAGNLGRCCVRILTQLYLVGCNINDHELIEMVQGLRLTVGLRELWLKANPIGKQGACVLADIIRQNTTLMLLSLLGCGSIGERGATALVQSLLCNNSLKYLQLSEAFKTACENVQGYSRVVHQLEWGVDFTKQSAVDIKGRNINCEVLVHALRGNTALTELRLVRCFIDGSNIAQLRVALRDIHTLAVLDLSSNWNIGNNTKELALFLKGHTTLTALILQECSISSNSLSNLTPYLRNITILDLSGNNIGNDGAKHLAMALEVNTDLTHLMLCYCGIDDDGMAHISSSLINKPLQYLILKKNIFSSEGINCLSLFLAKNTTLMHLDLYGCEIGADEVVHILMSLRNEGPLQNLDLGLNLFASIGAHDLAQVLKENTTLTHLSLSDCGISADEMLHLSILLRNKPLQHLNLGWNKFASKGAEYLALALAENTTLTHLVLPCCEIGGDGMAHLSSSLKNKPLQHLVLSFNHIFLKGAEYLAQALAENTTLTHLELHCCCIGATGMACLSQSLKNKPLQYLDLGWNNFASEGAQHLVNALKGSTTLTQLQLECCEIDGREIIYMKETLNYVKISFGAEGSWFSSYNDFFDKPHLLLYAKDYRLNPYPA